MDNQFEEYCVTKIDQYLVSKKIEPAVKRKFKETSEIYGTVYKFSHFGVEVIRDQVTIFGKYNKEFFDAELYSSTDELLEAMFPIFQNFHNDPNIVKHPIIRFFTKFKK